MIIAKSVVEEFLSRPLDDFSWMKKLSRRDLLSALWALPVPPQFKTTAWLHQLVCVYIGICHPRFLFLLDMGLGKTKIMLDLMQHRKDTKQFKKALVTVPRVINLDGWEEDVGIHSDLKIVKATGSISDKWDALHEPSDIVVIDYHGFILALTSKKKFEDKDGVEFRKLKLDEKKTRDVSKLFNFGVADEIHKLMHHDSLPSRSLKTVSKQWEFMYGLTGTLMGRDPTAAWSQFNIVDQGASFGKTLGLFRSALFEEVTDFWAGSSWKFDPKRDPDFLRMKAHRSIYYGEDECLDLPRKIPRTVKLRFTQEMGEHYLRALQGLVDAQGDVQAIDNAFVRMRQITSGYVVWGDDFGRHKHAFEINPKMDALEKLVDESGEKQILIYYDYTETGRIISERLTKLKESYVWIYSGNKNQSRDIARFRSDPKCRIMLANHASVGTGGNLQMAKYEIFYESPCSPIDRRQAEKRSAERGGQTDRVFVVDLVIERSIDVRVLGFIEEGEDLHKRLVSGRNADSMKKDFEMFYKNA